MKFVHSLFSSYLSLKPEVLGFKLFQQSSDNIGGKIMEPECHRSIKTSKTHSFL